MAKNRHYTQEELDYLEACREIGMTWEAIATDFDHVFELDKTASQLRCVYSKFNRKRRRGAVRAAGRPSSKPPWRGWALKNFGKVDIESHEG